MKETHNHTKNSLRAYLEANRRVEAELSNPTQFIPVTILNSFLGVALWGDDDKGEPVPLEGIARHLGISPTTLSTHLKYLGDRYREGKPGMGLVESEPYTLNRRMKTVRLTRKGKLLADQLVYLLNGASNHADTATG